MKFGKKILGLLLFALVFAGAEPVFAQKLDPKKTLIVYYSWGGTTEGIAKKIQKKLKCDIFEIKLVKPYSDSYETVLKQAQEDQNKQARPAIKNKVKDFSKYDTILLGYPNWWASIPMPIATFLESYDFTDKVVIPFCSNGGGRLGQSVSAITKLVPTAVVQNPLSIYYSGGNSLDKDLDEWLKKNGF